MTGRVFLFLNYRKFTPGLTGFGGTVKIYLGGRYARKFKVQS
jgi:hypothetical protein